MACNGGDCPSGECDLVMCPSGGPAPDVPDNTEWPRIVDRTAVALVASAQIIQPNDTVEVGVFLTAALTDLSAYQLHLESHGGKSGTLDLVDIVIEPRKNAAFGGQADWQAFNVETGQMLAGLSSAGDATKPRAYLATFVFRASPDAVGLFHVDLLHDEADIRQRTYLLPTAVGEAHTISKAEAAQIKVLPRRRRP